MRQALPWIPAQGRDDRVVHKWFAGIFLVVLILSFSANAAPKFPELTGRVVDDAHMLSPDATNYLNQSLENYENGTGNQVAVVTLSSLQGYDIADYGYQLGRAWGIGQKEKNNGALLIVAPNERKVRIEVGYGLEGDLTDAQVSVIIQQVILPAFRNGAMEQGVVAGTQAILQVLGGESVGAARQQVSGGSLLPVIIMLIVFFFLFRRNPLLGLLMLNSFGRSSGGFGGGSSGGGFRGGGGSFGGGGGSGSW